MGRKFSHCTTEETNKILRFRLEGLTIRELAKQFNRSKTTICNICKNNGIKNTSKKTKKMSFTESDQKYIALISKRNRKKNSPNVN